MSDLVAEGALDVALDAVGHVDDEAPSDQVSILVDATVDVFRGVAQHLRRTSKRKRNKPESVKRSRRVSKKLNARADDFCNAVTNNSASGAAAVSSASSDFAFNCQKNQQRGSLNGESVEQVAYT